MKPTTRIAIAGLLSAAGAALNAFAAEMNGTPCETTSEPVAETQPEPVKQKRTRAVKEEPAPVETAAPAEEKAVVTQVAEVQVAAGGGEIVSEEDYLELKDLIEPLVKGGQGLQVKNIIKQFSNSEKMREIRAAQKDDFVKEIKEISQYVNGKAIAELKVLTDPLVKGGQADEVNAIITKYSKTGKLNGIVAAQKAAFEKDIEAISL